MTLEISGLCAGYGNKQILKDVSVSTVSGGEFVGLIGPNASGKSTLFKSIAGAVKTTEGEITLDGRDLRRASRGQRSKVVAYMPQSYGCNAVLTVFECVLLALKQTTGWRVKDSDLQQVSSVLQALDLSHLADRGISNLSGGQAQMVSVAQTLVREPRLVLLDEPTSALDLHHQLSILSTIRSFMQDKNMIVIAALHDLNLAAQFCDRLVLIKEGKVLADGKPEDVLSRQEIDDTYRVHTNLERTSRDTLYVDARLSA
ncbi:iron ABC transporter ATP-binding protein [Kiloniella litopenaei]|uniref:Iron ABC transporter ATP-binding protein n=1 Tax=Kiloniella litopenaei TaxID=1549748 RepID=A0A0M2RCU2_9PROT|nr:ABC transporter ATP-binding protein [Kiloniella litopenaei]KKJ78254.1 iron ABC transporter ATP-binding protein [Kiloniella litopenaei]